MKPAGEQSQRVLSVPVLILVAALVFPFVAALAMTKRLSHDEHQHVAAGALVAREGLLPYRDFPHFHTPYLVFIYAALFRATDHLLLAARLFTTLCAGAMVALVGSIGYALFRERGRGLAGCVCAGAVVLCLTAEIFDRTTGRAWNNEPALLFALLAFAAHVTAIARERSAWLIASGALLGLAIGTRLTFAPLVAPFAIALALHWPAPGWQARPLLSFAAGLLLGSLGFLFFFALAPEQTFFSTFEFAKINVSYRFGGRGAPRTMTLLTKLRYLWKEIARKDLPLLAAALLPVIAAYWATHKTGRRVRFDLRFILLLLPFLLLGSLAPSPLFYQYFYPFVPFLILAGLYALASIPPETRWFPTALSAMLVAACFSAAFGGGAYLGLRAPFSIAEWTPIKVHREAAILRSRVPEGRVLTLAPIFPVEAGLAIYPPFSSGAFAWRIAPHVEAAKAARIGLATPASLPAWLDSAPPAAVLLGFERTESDFKKYATGRAYRRESLSGHALWLAPEQESAAAK